MTRVINRMDKILLILSFIMFIFGLFMILDASSMKSFMEYGNNTTFFNKQLIILMISMVISVIIILFPMKTYKRFIFPITIGIIGLLIYLLVSGEITSGTKSWIYIGSFGLQPSEFAKVALIMFMGIYYRANLRYLNHYLAALIPAGVGAIYCLLTLLQPDGGTGLILFFITVMIFYAAPIQKEIKIKTTMYASIFVLLAVVILFIAGKSPLSAMQRDRFNFLKPCTRYQEASGYQVCNGYIAINNGKLLSVSPGNSQQKYLYLPEAFTDFIFPIIVEEFGLIPGVVIILIYMVIIYRCLVLAKKCVNVGNALICYGVACYIFLHVVINLVGVLGLLPLTGVPLPFLSYGGSFALSLSIALALVQRISIENYNYMQKKVLEKEGLENH
ncbi:MAG: FtsW/RodA/SpoVE family cell cycle protein [Bacilli bacterium]|nr:FtsW/RodA/SpoVE family cell cycle protein [Bacilli bacterium]